jgi:hypothetical protein
MPRLPRSRANTWRAGVVRPAFHVSNPFDRFDPVKQRLVRRRVLNHETGLAVDRQSDGVPSSGGDQSGHVYAA